MNGRASVALILKMTLQKGKNWAASRPSGSLACLSLLGSGIQ